MQTTVETCTRCGRERAPGALVCGLCGEMWSSAHAAPASEPRYSEQDDRRPESPAWVREALEPPREKLGSAAIFLAAGIPLAALVAFLPLVQYMGWFLSALTHEMGHTAAAWFLGSPAMPAIRLNGEAATVHGEPSAFLLLLVAAGLVALGWRLSEKTHVRVAAAGGAAAVYALFVFTGLGELLHLIGGHAGELTFAAVCFARALTGGWTSSAAERVLYSALGWYLVAHNAWLTFGIATNVRARFEYMDNTSFGIPNDYVRIGAMLPGDGLVFAAVVMTIAALLVLPGVYLIARLVRRI